MEKVALYSVFFHYDGEEDVVRLHAEPFSELFFHR